LIGPTLALCSFAETGRVAWLKVTKICFRELVLSKPIKINLLKAELAYLFRFFL
jgi:hypothetical protein